LHPVFSGSIDLTIQALFLEPNIDALNVRGQYIQPNGTIQYATYHPQYSWGYHIAGTYHFNPKYDVQISGLHFDKAYQRVFGQIIGNEGSLINDLHSTIQPNFTIINGALGQTYRMEHSTIRIHGGVQYADLATNENSAVQVISGADIIPSTKQVSRGYNGVGPRFGADLSYDLPHGFGFVGQAAVALLTGNQYSNTSFSPSTIPSRLLSMSAIVPDLEGKLGMVYRSQIQAHHLEIQVGWMWIEYLKAIVYDNYNLPLTISLGQPELALGIQGPYFGLKWVG
jgi:hypothetical protein